MTDMKELNRRKRRQSRRGILRSLRFAGPFDDAAMQAVAEDGATAMQQMIRLMPKPRLVACASDGADGYYAYTFLADAEQGDIPANRVLMAWNVAGPRTVELDVEAPSWRIHDMLGATRSLAAKRGTLTVDIGPCPVYLQPD